MLPNYLNRNSTPFVIRTLIRNECLQRRQHRHQTRKLISLVTTKNIWKEKYGLSSSSTVSSFLRRVGGAGFAIAFIQGGLVLHKYRAYPSLYVPPGLTWGLEEHLIDMSKDRAKKAFSTKECQKLKNRIELIQNRLKNTIDGIQTRAKIMLQKQSQHDSFKIAVIGDSLACGIGCVNTRDENSQLAPKERKENVSGHNQSDTLIESGPIFPKSFAKTLSRGMQRPIKWRSAGVDGGDIIDIRTYCVGIIEEEASKGQIPDAIIVLCGMNDLKKIVSDPFSSESASDFRSNLKDLIQAIKKHAPNTKVVFPEILTQQFDVKSIVNIFPLSFFLPRLISSWEWQKELVADVTPSSIMYFRMPEMNVESWYEKTDKGTRKSLRLIDGRRWSASKQ